MRSAGKRQLGFRCCFRGKRKRYLVRDRTHLRAGSYYNDNLVGNDANNWIRGATGNDVINGGNGVDTWYLDWNSDAVVASLMTASQNAAMGIVMTGDAAGDTVSNMENIYSQYSTALMAVQARTRCREMDRWKGFSVRTICMDGMLRRLWPAMRMPATATCLGRG